MRQARSAPRGRPAAPSWGPACLLLAVASVAACRVDLPQVECANALDCPSGQSCARGVCVARGDTGADDTGAIDLAPDDATDAADAALDSATDTSIDTVSGDADTAVADVALGRTIYVDPDGGNDANNGTAAAPVASPARALELLRGDRDTILLARGSYSIDASLVFEDLEALQLSGGHRPEASWGRISSSRSILVGDGPILVFRDIGTAQLTQISVVTNSGADGADGQPSTPTGPLETVTPVEARSGQTAVAVIAERSSIWLVQCSVEVGDGGDGGAGRVGRDGADGDPGDVGDNGCTLCDKPLGGEGGVAPACLFGELGAMAGGNGGDGAELEDSQDPGESGGGGEGGKGGLVGDNESVDGLDGNPVGGGSHGIAGGPLGYFRDGGWHPVAGSSGHPGENGHGGGGGAGGVAGAEDVRGPAGGGGGSGGCGGEGGGGGGGGGGAVAVLLVDADLRVDRSELQTGRGGAGGDGGPGGRGRRRRGGRRSRRDGERQLVRRAGRRRPRRRQLARLHRRDRLERRGADLRRSHRPRSRLPAGVRLGGGGGGPLLRRPVRKHPGEHPPGEWLQPRAGRHPGRLGAGRRPLDPGRLRHRFNGVPPRRQDALHRRRARRALLRSEPRAGRVQLWQRRAADGLLRQLHHRRRPRRSARQRGRMGDGSL